MLIGARLRQLREQKQMSQGDVEERTGLLRCYVSRVENGHTVPSLETLVSCIINVFTNRQGCCILDSLCRCLPHPLFV